jgi:predicted NACHT family NTPase
MNWTKHPIIPLPTKEKLKTLLDTKGAQAVFDLWKSREEAIKLSKEDPYHYGVTLESWKNAIDSLDSVDSLIISGGNRSGKTEFCAKMVVQAAIQNDRAEIICFAQDDSASKRIQQKAIYRYLPPEFKNKRKEKTAYLNYSEQNGFTGYQFILPNGS